VLYEVHIDSVNGQASVVKLTPKPRTGDGECIHLTLEDGRIVNLRMLGDSQFCAVIGHGPIVERRSRVRDS
jgi:hypothetical protein